MATRVADFDHNGLPDIISGSNNGAHTVDIILQTSPWMFTPTYACNQSGSRRLGAAGAWGALRAQRTATRKMVRTILR